MLLKGKRARIVNCAERKKDDLCSGKKLYCRNLWEK